jgi:hypothetical protein
LPLAGIRNEYQLIIFLTGAGGGSGNMEVINSVLLAAYAKGFCSKVIEYVFARNE